MAAASSNVWSRTAVFDGVAVVRPTALNQMDRLPLIVRSGILRRSPGAAGAGDAGTQAAYRTSSSS